MRQERATMLELLGRALDGAAVHVEADSLENALASHRAAQDLRRAADAIEAAAAATVETYLGRDYYKSGPNVFVVQQAVTWKIMDSDKAWRYVETINHEEGFGFARQLLDLATRKTAWEAMATRRNLRPEDVVDTFLFRQYGPMGLKLMPLDKAPAYVQKASDGVVKKLQRNTKGGDDNE